MRRIRLFTLLAAAGLLSASLLMTACDKDVPFDDETPPVTNGEATESDTTPQNEISYKVTVQNPDGTPSSDVIVKVLKDGEEVSFKLVGPTGFATFKLAEDTYSVLVETPAGEALHFDAEAAVLTPETPEITLTVYKTAAATQMLNAQIGRAHV